MDGDKAAKVRALRGRLDHPIIDADGHLLEPQALFPRYLERVGGRELVERVERELREHPTFSRGNRETGDMRGLWWGVPNDAYYLATVMAPRLLHRRLDEIGIDFAILYPTRGLALLTILDADVRRGAVRAINTMNAEICGPYRDRLAAAAAIPMHTPEEAIAELEFAASAGFRVAMIPPGVARPIPALERSHPGAFPYAAYFDNYGLDSFYDYDPLWRKFVELRFAVTSHGNAAGLRYLPLGRRSPTNSMFNHIGGHAYQQGELCRSLVMGGVATRFPNLSFGFLECGAGWACDLLHSLAEHWEKRNLEGLKNYDPECTDRARLRELLLEYGGPEFVAETAAESERVYAERIARDDSMANRDEWALTGVNDEADFARMFENFYFGCEADDPSVHRALDARANPFRARLKPVFSSDIGHWDVPDIKTVLLESHKLADKGLISEADYRDFVFTYPAQLHLRANPEFFAGTVVEGATAKLAA